MIYIAAPLFNESERALNARLRSVIQRPTFLPQDDGELFSDLIDGGMRVDEATRLILEKDLEALSRSDLLIAVLNGPHVDSGVSVEIGYFKALGRPIIGFCNDVRRELPTGFNPMVAGSLWRLVSTEHELVQSVEEFYEVISLRSVP